MKSPQLGLIRLLLCVIKNKKDSLLHYSTYSLETTPMHRQYQNARMDAPGVTAAHLEGLR